MRSPATVAAVALLALMGAALPAGAAGTSQKQLGQKQQGSGGLFLTVSGSENAWIRGVMLHCAPAPSGPHPQAVAACAALDLAKGDLDALTGTPGHCTREYDAVTVSATGTWRGTPTAWHKTYANACLLSSATGAVFGF